MINFQPKERLQQLYEKTIDSGLDHKGNIEDLDFYSLLCKATASNQLYKLFSCNLILFNYKFQDEDSVLIIFAIPVSSNNENDNKHVSERIMEIVEVVENCFTTVDYMNLNLAKEDKFSYMVVIKKIGE